MMKPADILAFWFETLEPRDWWQKNPDLDQRIREQFSDVYLAVSKEETSPWRESDEGKLAEIIVLDQFSRNMFRDMPEAFAHDALARQLSRAAVEAGTHTCFDQARASFLLMPFMHSELLSDHEFVYPLFEQYCSESTLDFEKRHAEIIRRFGRYPHRNEILGRQSTEEEVAFLTKPGSSF